jgi:hypothetical protein
LRVAFDGSRASPAAIGNGEADILGAWHFFTMAQILDRGIEIVESTHGQICNAGCAEGFVDHKGQASIARNATELDK